MKEHNKTYEDKVTQQSFDYKIYELESEEDRAKFIELFKKEKDIEGARLKNGPARKWQESKCRMFGFYKSCPGMFDVAVGNNFDRPFQFFMIELRKEYQNTL